MSIRARLLAAAAATGVIFAGISTAGASSAYADTLPVVPAAGQPAPSTGLPLPSTGGLPLPGTGLPLPTTGGLPLPNTGGISMQAPGYSQLSPQVGQVVDENGPRPPDVRLPELPGDGMFWHTTYWKNVEHRTHNSIQHAGLFFVPADRSSDWDMVVTELDAGSTGSPVVRLYMFCNMAKSNTTSETLVPYTDEDGTPAFDQSLTGGGQFAHDYIAWVHHFAWNAL